MATSSFQSKTFFCNERGRDLAEKYEMFYQQQQMFDVTLIAEDDNTSFRAHRTFLSASSDYFRQRFTSTESDAPELKLSNMNESTLKSILDFIYTGSIELNTDTIKNILAASDLLKIKTLLAACVDFIGEQLNTHNCLDLALYAEQYHHTVLKAKSLVYAYQHFEEVCTNQSFLLLNERRLNNFLSGYDLQVPSQQKLFISLIAWYKHNKVRREEAICSLLSQHVRVGLLDPKFIVEYRNQLSEIPKCSELMSSWLEWRKSPTIQHKTTKNIFIVYKLNTDSKFGVQSYNPELNQWLAEDWPNPSSSRTYYTTYIFNKKLIISGGFVNKEVTNSVECLDLQTLQWSQLPPMISKRYVHCMIELQENLYVIGGYDGTKWITSVEKYDFSEGRWQNVAPLPEEIHWGKAAVLNGLLYVSFGVIRKYYLQKYDPRINEWSQIASKNMNITEFGLPAFRGHLYAIGGRNTSTQRSKFVERYDPTNDKWTMIESLERGQHDLVCTTWNDRIIACGELRSDDKYDAALSEYNPVSKTWVNLAPFVPGGIINMWSGYLTTIE